MAKIMCVAAVCGVVFLNAMVVNASERGEQSIPFPDALAAAGVTLEDMDNGGTESFILGNGDLYGIVWEKDGGLFMRITKNDIWDARVDTSRDGPLPKVDIATAKVTGSRGAPPSYKKLYPQPRCAGALRFGPLGSKSLQAHLDIRKAVALIKPSNGKATRVRVLHDRNVVLIDTPGAVAIEEIKASTLPPAKTGTTGGVSWLLMKMPGDIDYKGMDYAIALCRKGDIKAVSLVTSYDIKTGDVLEKAVALARETIKQEEARLITEHERAWEKYWSASGVALADEPTQRWWYRMLYFAKTVCKPGCAPVALMPPLATDKTPWHADYHHNYNAWQAFWPLPASNQSELADPWISYVNDMLPRFKYLANVTYGIDGACVPISSFLHEPDPADCKSRNKRQMSMNPWGLTIGLGGMTVQSMWQKHLCDPDPEYMKARIYPMVRETARFYASFMTNCKKDEKGKILLGPSYSPEHGPVGIYNCPFDIAYVHYTFDALIQAAGELNVDKDLVAKCRKYKSLLGDYPTAVHKGEEIVVDWRGGRHIGMHNITVPASPVFPGDQVTWFSPDPVKSLFKRTIKATRFNGNNSHVMFNIAKARLSMPEGFTDGRKWFLSRELPNGFFVWKGHAHGVFMQEMIGVAGLVNEYLLQSVGRKIRVFPCWPRDKDARFAGLRAEGGFVVSAEQKAGIVVKLEIVSAAGGKLHLLSPWKTIKANSKVLVQDRDGIVTLDTHENQKLIFAESK